MSEVRKVAMCEADFFKVIGNLQVFMGDRCATDAEFAEVQSLIDRLRVAWSKGKPAE